MFWLLLLRHVSTPFACLPLKAEGLDQHTASVLHVMCRGRIRILSLHWLDDFFPDLMLVFRILLIFQKLQGATGPKHTL